MTMCRNSLIASLARKRAAGLGLAAAAAVAGLLATVGVAPASAEPPDACKTNSVQGRVFDRSVKGAAWPYFTMCMWEKRNGRIDVTYSGVLEDTAADGARAQLMGCVNCGDGDRDWRVLVEAVGKGDRQPFGRRIGGGIVRGVHSFELRRRVYDKSEDKVLDESGGGSRFPN
jgi:hypothetical protein